MKTILNFIRTIRQAARNGGRKYFFHNLACSYDWIWSIRFCLGGEGRVSDLPYAIAYPAFAKAMREVAIEDMRRMNQDFVAVYNEHSAQTFAASVSHYLGECEGPAGGCYDCVAEATGEVSV